MHRFTKETAAHILNILNCNLMEKRGGEEERRRGGKEGGRRREEEGEEEGGGRRERRGRVRRGGEKEEDKRGKGEEGKKMSIVPFFQPLQTPGLRSTPLLCQPVYGSLTTERRSVIPLGVTPPTIGP